ncbi:HAD family hydrolase [Desulfosporosinus sp. SB140]|uniref:HAD family hydrolase n=1 Tax=Desulfosporosinus paludis TaxID=3115649 RepID=UPI003890B5F6
MEIDSIIFDLDGTLWNSIAGICEAWQAVLAKFPWWRREKDLIDKREIQNYHSNIRQRRRDSYDN